MAEQAIVPTFTEDLLINDNPEVVDIDGIPTTSYEDSLRIANAVIDDVAQGEDLGLRIGIPEYCAMPTRDLSVSIEAHPFAGGGMFPGHKNNGLDYTRAIGLEVFDEAAQSVGFANFGDQWRASSEEDETMRSRWRLYDGGLTYDTYPYAEGGRPALWQELIEKYGADDPAVITYFERVATSLRIDANGFFRYINPTPVWDFGAESKAMIEKKRRVGTALSKFLLDRGYDPKPSGVVIVNLDSGARSESVVSAAGEDGWQTS